MKREEYLEELISIKGDRLRRFESLVRNGFKIENKLYNFEAEVSEYYLRLKSGEEEINIPYPSLEFDEGTVVVPFGGNTYLVGVDSEIEGTYLYYDSLFKYLQMKGFNKRFIFNGDEFVKGNILLRFPKKKSIIDVMSDDVLLKVPVRNLMLTDAGLVVKVINTCIKIV